MRYQIAVISINYNSSEHTIKMVRSIYEHTDPSINFQVIVVDNNSDKEDYAKLDQVRHYGNLSILRSRINLGFAAGNMFAVQFASASYYFFLNNDCVLRNDCLSILWQICESDHAVGMCSPQLCDETGSPLVSFDYFPEISSKFFGKGVFKITRGRRYIPRKKQLTEPVQVEVLSGSHLFLPANVFNNLGGFDTNFFLYCEEEDLALRVHKAGLKIMLVPEAKNTHIGGQSTIRSLEIEKEFIISFLYFYRKHYGVIKTQFLRLFLFVRYFKRALVKPRYWYLVLSVLMGIRSDQSLRHKQKISTS